MDLPSYFKSVFGITNYPYQSVSTEDKVKYGWYLNHLLSKKFPLQSTQLSKLSPEFVSDAWWAILGHTGIVPVWMYPKKNKTIITDKEKEILEENDIELTSYLINNFEMIKSDIDLLIETKDRFSDSPIKKKNKLKSIF